MNGESTSAKRGWALAAAVALAAATALAAIGLATGRLEGADPWVGLAASGAGLVLMAWVAARPGAGPWVVTAAAVPIVLLVLGAAPMAVTRGTVPVARLVASALAAGAYLMVAAPLAARFQYGACCACLAVAAGFFFVWEPPPPKPVPIRKPLARLADSLERAFPGWTVHRRELTEDIEAALGADEYVNLYLQSPDGRFEVLVFVTYNANAMSNIPHVPWVCMTQSGYDLALLRGDDVMADLGRGRAAREFKANVMLFKPGAKLSGRDAVMFQYFNVGGQYERNRQLARVMASSGAIGPRGSYISQTQVAVWFREADAKEPMDKRSPVYQMGLRFLNQVVPLLEREHYPDLSGTQGG